MPVSDGKTVHTLLRTLLVLDFSLKILDMYSLVNMFSGDLKKEKEYIFLVEMCVTIVFPTCDYHTRKTGNIYSEVCSTVYSTYM